MKYTNEMNLPLSLVSAITNDTYSKGAADISVTTLIQPPKIRVLTDRHQDELTEDVADCIYRLMGTNTHAIIEQIQHKDALQEERLFIKAGGWTISGQADLYEDEIVHDYKTTSAYAILHGIKPEWVSQLNCYASGFRQAGFSVKGLKIIAILRDWSKFKAKEKGNYPRKQVTTLDIPLWAPAKAKAYIEGRVALHQAADELADDDIEACSPEERWHDPDSWAVVKGTNKKATRVLDSLEKAETMKAHLENSTGKDYRIDYREGSDKRCLNYCSASHYCHHFRSLVPF